MKSVGSHGISSLLFITSSRWWSDTLWVTLIRLWLHWLSCYCQIVVVEISLQFYRYPVQTSLDERVNQQSFDTPLNCNQCFHFLCKHCLAWSHTILNFRFLQGPDTDQNTVQQIRDAISARKDITVQLLNYTKSGTHFMCPTSVLFHFQFRCIYGNSYLVHQLLVLWNIYLGWIPCSGPGISKYEWWNALVLLCSRALTSTALECWKPVL